MRLFALVLSISLSNGLLAQYGFIVTREGDTIAGRIISGTPAVNAGKVGFKEAKSQKKVIYRPSQIKSWSTGAVCYKSKTLPTGSKNIEVFMLRKTPAGAQVHCYDYWNADGAFGFSQVFLEKRMETQKKLQEVRFGGQFYKQLSAYFEDNAELRRRISNKEFKKTLPGLMEIVTEYNTWKEHP